ELLVVIGIISVLVAILLPALNKVRESAKSVQCLSNLRQLGIVMTIYAGEHNGWQPPKRISTPAGAASWYWPEFLMRSNYVTQTVGASSRLPEGIFVCPS